jgi:Cu-Zn family superoxide dismutase
MEKGLAMRKVAAVTLVLLLPGVVLWAADADKHEGPQKAIAVLHPASGSQVHGWVTFTRMDGYVEIKGEVAGLTPGQHAFHIHEFGDCSSPDALSTGGHFNPHHKMHGGPDSENRHAGDFGNITADASGRATIELKDKALSMSGADSIIGRAVIIHAMPDDLKTQPTGNAGGRVACGVIGIAKGK